MCRRDDTLYRSTVLPVVLKADQRSHHEKCVNCNEAAIRELLTICSEAEIILQVSEMVSGALYTSHERSRVFTGSLRVVCERTHRFRKITGSVNEPKSDHPGTDHGTHFPCIIRIGCVKEAIEVTTKSAQNKKATALFFACCFLFKQWSILRFLSSLLQYHVVFRLLERTHPIYTFKCLFYCTLSIHVCRLLLLTNLHKFVSPL